MKKKLTVPAFLEAADVCRRQGSAEEAEMWELLAYEQQGTSIADRIVFAFSLAVIVSAIGYPMADMAGDLLAYFGEISARWLS